MGSNIREKISQCELTQVPVISNKVHRIPVSKLSNLEVPWVVQG